MDEVEIFFANFEIPGPLGCQGWVFIPQNVKKCQNHCPLVHMSNCQCGFIPIDRQKTTFFK
jgi:hypothetical protein